MQTKLQRTRMRGFTIVELIATLIILSIIAVAAFSRYFAADESARIAVLKNLSGELNSKVSQLIALSFIPGKVTEAPGSSNLKLVAVDDETNLLTQNTYLHARDLCQALGLVDRAANRNGTIDSEDGRFRCKDENRFLGWITIDDWSRDQCYIHYNTYSYNRKPFATVTCRDPNSSQCICPGD